MRAERSRDNSPTTNTNHNEINIFENTADDIEMQRKARRTRIAEIQKRFLNEKTRPDNAEISNKNIVQDLKCRPNSQPEIPKNTFRKDSFSSPSPSSSSSSAENIFDITLSSKPQNKDQNLQIDLGLKTQKESVGYYQPKINDLLNFKYKVIGLCGKGIFSSVVKVIDITSNIVYALKVIRNIEIMKDSGNKEKQIISLLNSQNRTNSHIIALISTFDFNNHTCLILPLYKMNLRDYLKQHSQGLSLNQTRTFAKQLIEAFIWVHKCRYIHTDFKPDNAWIDNEFNNVYICDFGSALKDDEMQVTSELVSRYYRAPEIIWGIKPNNKIDIWAWGCTLYELFTGDILFQGADNKNMICKMWEMGLIFNVKTLNKGEYVDLYFDRELNCFNGEEKRIDLNRFDMIFERKWKDKILQIKGGMRGFMEEDWDKFIHLLKAMLSVDTNKRLSAMDAYSHPFWYEKLNK